MSAVINRAKQHYAKSLKVEGVILLLISIGLLGVKGNVSISFLTGSLASFLPFGLFVYWVFFKKSAKNSQNLTAFYWGEGIKWMATIILLIIGFTAIPHLHIWAFFVGYFLALLLNNVIPFMLSRQTQ